MHHKECKLDTLKMKHLGVQIDFSLDWKELVKAVSAKVSMAVGFLKHDQKFLPRELCKCSSTLVLLSLTFDIVGAKASEIVFKIN